MKKEIQNAWGHLGSIKVRLKMGGTSYDDAVIEAKPHLEVINAEMKILSKKFKKAFYPLTFTKVMR